MRIKSSNHGPKLLLFEGSGEPGYIGHEGDLGCVACKVAADEDTLIIDSRGRYWHAKCGVKALGEITRTDEKRGNRFHYHFGEVPRG